LIKNAIQATDDVIDAEIIISLERSKGKVLVKVQDNGHGVPENIKDKIFEPNFTTKSSGMGLGLALVKNIVDGCDGAVWFESNSKKGTTFYLALSEVD
jgi:signal transduction histidine kinase